MRFPASLLALALTVCAFAGPNDPLPRKTWFGAQLNPAPVEAAGAKGISIVAVIPDSTAEAAGIKANDVVLTIAGKPITTSAEITQALARQAAEQGQV